MLVGILESVNDPFIADLISRLQGVTVEFISLSDEVIPLRREYRVVVDRISFCYPYLREIVKNLSLNGVYVINNPFTVSSTNKIVDINLAGQLGLNFPKTIVLPDRVAMEEIEGLVAAPRFNQIAEELGLPCVLKPFDGYGWQDVYVVKSIEEMQNLYLTLSGRLILVAQQLIHFTDYFRVFCFDKREVLFIRWVPKPLAMGHYLYCDQSDIMGNKEKLIDLTTCFNKVLDLDVNVMEWCVDEQGQWWVIDAFNAFPDIDPETLPPEYYSWIVDRFADCVKDKLENNKQNYLPFGYR